MKWGILADVTKVTKSEFFRNLLEREWNKFDDAREKWAVPGVFAPPAPKKKS